MKLELFISKFLRLIWSLLLISIVLLALSLEHRCWFQTPQTPVYYILDHFPTPPSIRHLRVDYFHFARYNSISSEICVVLQWNSSYLNTSVPNILYQAFIWIFFLLDFLRSLSLIIASSQQNIIKMKVIINASNIPFWLWAGLCCQRINSFAQIFDAYVSTPLLFCIYSLISNRRKKAQQ